jgi:hypothetical protein
VHRTGAVVVGADDGVVLECPVHTKSFRSFECNNSQADQLKGPASEGSVNARNQSYTKVVNSPQRVYLLQLDIFCG